jgi:hypothetical protein
MKQTAILLTICTAITFFTYCGGSKKAQVAAPPKMTFDAHVLPIINTECSPCHIPGKGNKTPYVTAASVRTDIDDIIHRIGMQPGEKGFMPMRHPRLSDSAINVFVQWKADGMLEK